MKGSGSRKTIQNKGKTDILCLPPRKVVIPTLQWETRYERQKLKWVHGINKEVLSPLRRFVLLCHDNDPRQSEYMRHRKRKLF